MPTIKELIEVAKEAAIEAGKILKQGRESLRHVNVETANDFKTQADLESEKLIRSRLEPLGLPIIGEEGGGEAPADPNELYWAVDPLDGTVNYVHGLKFSTVSIGLMRGQEPVGGAVYDFWHDKLYWAAEGEGAWIDDERLEARPYERRSNQIVASSESTNPKFLSLKEEFMQPRNLWCGSMQICCIAEGILGAMYTDAFFLWDWAGATALLRELGLKYKATLLNDGVKHHYSFEAFREMASKD